MRQTLYYLVRRSLTQERRDRLKTKLARGRKRLWPMLRVVNGSFDSASLRQELSRRLPQVFDILMVHCSFDDLLPMYKGDVAQLLAIFRELCATDRTLVMPSFTYQVPGRELAVHLNDHPRFDARRQPSQMGLLSEVFRRTPGVRRSLHPTHSVCALGPLAARLTGEHHLGGTTFGARSPFERMTQVDTVIMGLGKPYYRVLTQIHTAEDLLGDRFPVPRSFQEIDMKVVDGSGEHPYRFRLDTSGLEYRLDRLPRLLAPGDLTVWRFHGVPMFWVRADRVTNALCAAALRGKTIYAGPTLA